MINANGKSVTGGRTLAIALGVLLLSCVSAAQARTLSFAMSSPPSETRVNQVWEWWAGQVKEQSAGSLEIKYYWLQSLVKLKDVAGAVSSGIADIAFISPAHSPDKMPLWYLENTRTGSGDQYVVAEALRRVRNEDAPLKEEEKRNNMKYIVHVSNGPQVFLSKDRPYLTPEDFKGDKVRMPGTMAKVAMLADWNVSPVSLPFPDIYSAMERGTVDGAMTYVPLIGPNSQNEVGKYVVEPNLGQNCNVVMMNLNTWNSLDAKQQALIDGLQDELLVKLARASVEDEAHYRVSLQKDPKYPLEFRKINAQQRAEWAKGLALGADEMVKQMSRWSDHAAAFHKKFRAEIDKVEQEVARDGYPWDKQASQ
ncbi:C4-dicarboxylate ABC transporter substrate-binding protein (plasmid) [Alcanivorax sp. N3-2A]|nr:C4-dicarboxylate ABC transporter substrate-binding protein [Alcanivorax sp. N3-2A]ASK36721.1 C4-dicarboxylate ABC transporter substrate-binding protein [Alcanivorax sp. N3-2A]|tara:strand:- start:7449 stop:8549 length:1101 start_codon:yes stop_codon:yes gene_type:complete